MRVQADTCRLHEGGKKGGKNTKLVFDHLFIDGKKFFINENEKLAELRTMAAVFHIIYTQCLRMNNFVNILVEIKKMVHTSKQLSECAVS